MRSLLLLLFLSICATSFAKKKTFFVEITAKSISAKSVENAIHRAQLGAEFHGDNAIGNFTPHVVPFEGSFYFNNGFIDFDRNSQFEENSYTNNIGNGGSSSNSTSDTSVQDLATLDSQTIFRQGMYYGFALMLVLLNLVCFFLFEEKTFLFYSLALAAMSSLLFYSDGLFSLLGLDLTNGVLNAQAIFLMITAITGALFVSKFLSLNEKSPKLKYATILVLVVATTFLTFAWITDSVLMTQIANGLFFSVLGTYFVAGVFLFGKKNYAKFFVIASFIPLLFSFDFFVLGPMGVDFLSTQTMHIKAAAIAEMLIMTYAIMYRMQALKEEHSHRQAEMRIFLKRQEAIATRAKTERFVEDMYLENLIMHYDLDGLEIKLLQYISEGKENAKIARKLKTTENEIEEMTKDLYEKLEISEQIQQDYRMVESQPDYIYN
ncbi:MAG: 7TM diverse intracellular signaling domain-containing protein [Saprospiraceae bacterium]